MDFISVTVIIIFVISVGLLAHTMMTWGKRMGAPIEENFKDNFQNDLASFDEEVRKIKELVDEEDRKTREESGQS